MQMSPVLEAAGCSNGMAFGLGGRIFYHTDSFAQTITRYLYDEATGEFDGADLFVGTAESMPFLMASRWTTKGAYGRRIGMEDSSFVTILQDKRSRASRFRHTLRRVSPSEADLNGLFVKSAADEEDTGPAFRQTVDGEEATGEYPFAGALFRLNVL